MKVMKTLQNLAKGMVPETSAPGDHTRHTTPGSRASQAHRFENLGEEVELDGFSDSEGSEDGSHISSKGIVIVIEK